MRTILVFAFALAMYAAPVSAHSECCAGPDCCPSDDCCASAPCCAGDAAVSCCERDTMAHIVPSTEPLPALDRPPVRVTAAVMFYNPVWVNGRVLMGRHIIEHDTDRMARGEPCTHIYAADDRRRPVVTFHCTHVIRPTSPRATVTLRRDSAMLPGGYLLTEFQFAGERAAHGVPGIRGVDPVR
jgi:hypothetical protein